MTADQFLKLASSLLGDLDFLAPSAGGRRGQKETSPPAFGVEWRIGGRTGGSCWATGEQPHYPLEASPEPDLEGLDRLLEKVCPAVSFLKYKELLKDLLRRGERCEDGFYGNYTNYGRKWIVVHELYDWLVKEDLLKSQ